MSDYCGIPCTWMRGGTSKGLFFLAEHLPADREARNALLLRLMGSPDQRQIDGVGGADPLTSKVAIVSRSHSPNADIDYLFLQVSVDEPLVSDAQNCGNLLSGVGQFALENNLINAAEPETTVRVHMLNSGQVADVTFSAKNGSPVYDGEAVIDGVPGTASPVLQNFPDVAGSTCGSLFPSGNRSDTIEGIDATLIDNGMPVVIMNAQNFAGNDVTGFESREQLDSNVSLRQRVEAIRLLAGPMMNLGDVSEKFVPKMMLVAPPRHGNITTRTFIPHRCHASIGVFAAISVATSSVLDGTVASRVARLAEQVDQTGADHPALRKVSVAVEHPLGSTTVVIELTDANGRIQVQSAALLRTARKLMEGRVFARPLPAQ